MQHLRERVAWDESRACKLRLRLSQWVSVHLLSSPAQSADSRAPHRRRRRRGRGLRPVRAGLLALGVLAHERQRPQRRLDHLRRAAPRRLSAGSPPAGSAQAWSPGAAATP
jgi:hypothetical protein